MGSDNLRVAPSTPLREEQKVVIQQHEPKLQHALQQFQLIHGSSISARPFHPGNKMMSFSQSDHQGLLGSSRASLQENPKLFENLDKEKGIFRPSSSVLQSHEHQNAKKKETTVVIKRECLGPPMISEQSLRTEKQKQLQHSFPPTFSQMNLASQPPNASEMNLPSPQKVFRMNMLWLLQQQMQPVKTAHEKCSDVVAAGRSILKPGMCVQRLNQYMYHQQQRPRDNNIEFWRNFVAEFFAPNAKKRVCLSLSKSRKLIDHLFPQEAWNCEMCKLRPTAGFEIGTEALPRLCKINYDSGMLEELLYVDMPEEYYTTSGHIVLNYTKVIEESVYEAARVVREGRLRIVFSSDLKICLWEFCCSSHEVLIDRRSATPQVHKFREAVQRYQAFARSYSGIASEEFQRNSNQFVSSIRELARVLDKSLVSELGYAKRYVRCLQISEIVNSMKDLMDYSRKYGIGPAEAMARICRLSTASSVTNNSVVKEEQAYHDDAKDEEDSSVMSYCPFPSCEGIGSVKCSHDATSPTTSTASSKRVAHLADLVEPKRKKQMTNLGEHPLLLSPTEPVMDQPFSTTPPSSSIMSLPVRPSNTMSVEPSEHLSTKVKVEQDVVTCAAAAAADAMMHANVLQQNEKKNHDKIIQTQSCPIENNGKYCDGFETDGVVNKSYYMDQFESDNANGVSLFPAIHSESSMRGMAGTLMAKDTQSNNQQFNDRLPYLNGKMDPIDDIQFD